MSTNTNSPCIKFFTHNNKLMYKFNYYNSIHFENYYMVDIMNKKQI